MILNRFVLPLLTLTLTVPVVARASALPPQRSDYQGQWDAPPRELNDMQRRGFRDGVDGARKDYGNNRRPDVNNREEYRHPDSIPPDMREAYQDGFRRGYNSAVPHLWNGALPPVPVPVPVRPPAYSPPGNGDWGMRGMNSDPQRQGYREGMQEARKDFNFHRNPDPDDHEEYRNPYIDPQYVDEYREGFMRGYEVAWSQLSGDNGWQNGGDPGQWTAPNGFNDMARQGFRDGVVGAQRDYGNHRRPDPNNRDEYRSPNVPPEFRDEYCRGFRRGYEMTASRLWGGQ